MLKQLFQKAFPALATKQVPQAATAPEVEVDEDLSLPLLTEMDSYKPTMATEDPKALVRKAFYPHKYTHIRADRHLGLDTKAALTVYLSDCPNSETLVRMSVAVCSGRDNFSRQQGRSVAVQRMVDGNYLTINRDDIVAVIALSQLSMDKSSPSEDMLRVLRMALRTGSYTEGSAWDFSPLRYFFRKIGTPLYFEEAVEE